MIDVTSGRKSKSKLKMDLLKSFGADFQLGINSPLHFVGESGNSIIYPVGHHLAIRDIFGKEDLRKNDVMFIYNDDDVQKLTSMNTTRDYNLFLTCEIKQRSCIISIYNLSKLNFKSIMIFKAMRRIESTIYKEFISKRGTFVIKYDHDLYSYLALRIHIILNSISSSDILHKLVNQFSFFIV